MKFNIQLSFIIIEKWNKAFEHWKKSFIKYYKWLNFVVSKEMLKNLLLFNLILKVTTATPPPYLFSSSSSNLTCPIPPQKFRIWFHSVEAWIWRALILTGVPRNTESQLARGTCSVQNKWPHISKWEKIKEICHLIK